VHRERARCDRPIPDGRRCAGVRTPLSVRTARTGFFSMHVILILAQKATSLRELHICLVNIFHLRLTAAVDPTAPPPLACRL
jgi:hypothetical protein